MKKYTKCIENLRKYSMALAAVLCCATATTALTSCGDDDPTDSSSSGSSGTGDTTKATGMRIIANYTATEDLLSYCNIKVEYNDGTGAKTEDVTSTTWSKTIEIKSAGVITVKSIVTMKDDKDLPSAKDNIKCQLDYVPKCYLLDAAGKSIREETLSNKLANSSATAVESLADGVQKGEFNYTYTYQIDENGKVTSDDKHNYTSSTPTISDTQVGWARRTHPTGGWEYPKNAKSNSSTTTTTSDSQVGWARRTHPTGEKYRSVKSNSSTTTTTSDTQVGMVRK